MGQEDEKGRKIRIWSESDSGKTNIVSNNLFDCEIMSHEETLAGHSYNILWSSGSTETIVKGVPHKAIVFLDKPEEGDQHIWNSFRHYISMGDIFPKSGAISIVIVNMTTLKKMVKMKKRKEFDDGNYEITKLRNRAMISNKNDTFY